MIATASISTSAQGERVPAVETTVMLCGDCPVPEKGRVRWDLHFLPRLSGQTTGV